MPHYSRSAIEENKVKLDRLLEMKLDNMIDNAEYLTKKNKLIEETKELESNLVKNKQNAAGWLELTEGAFNFITYSRAWLMKGDKIQKKKILLGLCSNPALKNKKLLISMQNYLEIVKDITSPYRDENGLFELPIDSSYKTKTGSLEPALSTMQGLVDAVATYFQGIEPGSVYVPKCDKNRFE